VIDTNTQRWSNASPSRVVRVIAIAILAASCSAPSTTPPSPTAAPPLTPSITTPQSTPAANETRGLAGGARDLADQVLRDIDVAIAIERNTPGDREFTEAIAAWFASEFDYLASHQAVLASDDGFLPLTHQLSVIQSLLTENDPLVLRGVVRELDDAREALRAVR
jgi:hypothetical protein